MLHLTSRGFFMSADSPHFVALPFQLGSQTDRSNTGIMGPNPGRVFLCAAVLCRYRPSDKPIPVQGSLPKYLKGFIISEANCVS